MKNLKKYLSLLLVVCLTVTMAMSVSAATPKVDKKVVIKSSVQTMALWRYGKSQGWDVSWTEKKDNKNQLTTTLKFVNKKYNMTIKQVVKKSGKKVKVSYFQDKTEVGYKGIKRTLKKYKN